MESLELDWLRVAVKEIASGRALRLVVSTTSTARCTEADERRFLAWFDRFYEHVERHQKSFCLIYVVPESVDNPEQMRFFVDALHRKRDVTRQYSLTTCIVASGLVAMVANVAITMYGVTGRVHFTDTLEEAKRVCRDYAQER